MEIGNKVATGSGLQLQMTLKRQLLKDQSETDADSPDIRLKLQKKEGNWRVAVAATDRTAFC